MELLLEKFIIGGLGIVVVTMVAQMLGGKVGGFLAGFPAVFLMALTVTAWGHDSRVIDPRLTKMVWASVGALAADVLVAWVAPKILSRWRFRLAYPSLLTIWAGVSGVGYLILTGFH
ncbi:MAG: DUF3147 family protein [Sulfobacillus sp.]